MFVAKGFDAVGLDPLVRQVRVRRGWVGLRQQRCRCLSGLLLALCLFCGLLFTEWAVRKWKNLA